MDGFHPPQGNDTKEKLKKKKLLFTTDFQVNQFPFCQTEIDKKVSRPWNDLLRYYTWNPWIKKNSNLKKDLRKVPNLLLV